MWRGPRIRKFTAHLSDEPAKATTRCTSGPPPTGGYSELEPDKSSAAIYRIVGALKPSAATLYVSSQSQGSGSDEEVVCGRCGCCVGGDERAGHRAGRFQ